MIPQMIVICLIDRYLKSVTMEYCCFFAYPLFKGSGFSMNSKSSKPRGSFLFIFAILLRDYRSLALPWPVNMKFGVSSKRYTLNGIKSKEGRSIHHPAIIFQLSINIERRETADIPNENII